MKLFLLLLTATIVVGLRAPPLEPKLARVPANQGNNGAQQNSGHSEAEDVQEADEEEEHGAAEKYNKYELNHFKNFKNHRLPKELGQATFKKAKHTEEKENKAQVDIASEEEQPVQVSGDDDDALIAVKRWATDGDAEGGGENGEGGEGGEDGDGDDDEGGDDDDEDHDGEAFIQLHKNKIAAISDDLLMLELQAADDDDDIFHQGLLKLLAAGTDADGDEDDDDDDEDEEEDEFIEGAKSKVIAPHHPNAVVPQAHTPAAVVKNEKDADDKTSKKEKKTAIGNKDKDEKELKPVVLADHSAKEEGDTGEPALEHDDDGAEIMDVDAEKDWEEKERKQQAAGPDEKFHKDHKLPEEVAGPAAAAADTKKTQTLANQGGKKATTHHRERSLTKSAKGNGGVGR